MKYVLSARISFCDTLPCNCLLNSGFSSTISYVVGGSDKDLLTTRIPVKTRTTIRATVGGIASIRLLKNYVKYKRIIKKNNKPN